VKLFITVTPEHVKAECQRRIEAAYPWWRQRNVDRRGGADQVAMDKFIDDHIAASHRIEAMTPIPHDYRTSPEWPEDGDDNG